MMKKVILLIVLCMAAVFLSGCLSSADDVSGTDETLNYAAFLELLEANGFSFEEVGEYSGFLSAPQRRILIGNEQLKIYEFRSNEAMERNASFVGSDGFSIHNRDTGHTGQTVLVSWAADPYWFKKDLIIVLYVGEDQSIIHFLAENLVFFAGYNDPNVNAGAPFLTGFYNISGTVASIEPYADGMFSVLIDYIHEYMTFSDEGVIMPGTQVQVQLFVDQNTLMLTGSEMKAGMEIIAYHFIAQPGDASTKRAAFLITCRDYAWVHVNRFDENFMSLGGHFSLHIFEDAEIVYQNGSVFEGELAELTNRLLAVYVVMSASPAPGEPQIHGIGTNRVIILD